jgi:putative nucleotidyltransferase with HDIG domain
MILTILLLTTAAFVWAVIDDWERALDGLREAYDSTLEGWAQALGYRDQETGGHSRRVAELSVALAEKLGHRGENLEHIRRGAYLHDIGKMAIPDRILNKPGPLDESEWEIMKRHPELAMQMLGSIQFLQPALSIPHSHHERWDGGGYPQGLAGEAIPPAARIFTIVDHWEALRSDRPYRKAWPQEKILEHIRTNAGAIYDPQVASAFLELIGERNFD